MLTNWLWRNSAIQSIGCMIFLLAIGAGRVWGADAVASMALRGHADGRLDGRLVPDQTVTNIDGWPVACRFGDSQDTVTTSVSNGTWTLAIPDAWRSHPDQLLHITAGTNGSAIKAVYSLHKISLPYLPPLSAWGADSMVDEPQSAFYSIGRTMWHVSRNAGLIVKFHDFLREQKIDPITLLDDNTSPPETVNRILVEPELTNTTGWQCRGDWLVGAPGHRGADARIPLRIDRAGLYRCWIRYMGFKDGVAVTSFNVYRAGQEHQAALVEDEFNTLPADADGPAWHTIMLELEKGDYTIILGHVVRYYHTPQNVPMKEHQVDCIYLTEELWRAAPTDAERAEMKQRTAPAGIKWSEMPTLTQDDKNKWFLWQVRPTHWERAKANPRLFTLSYEFWRREIEAISEMSYNAPPTDPVAGGIADYRDPRRQVNFDPIWNMVANPYRIRTQRQILEDDIDPLAKDAFYATIAPGFFPVVEGQWERSGAGLSAWDAATKGLAAGTYTVPRGGTWHLWVKFKNINYYEYFGVYADTLWGRAAVWERNKRLYPGGRGAWDKVGTIDVPNLSETEIAEHRAKAARGVLVENGKPVFVITQGVWQCENGYMEATGANTRVTAQCALNATNNFFVRARMTLTGLAGSGAAFVFTASNGVKDCVVQFEGVARGLAFGTGVTFNATSIKEGEPFDFEFAREGTIARISINRSVVATVPLMDPPGGAFGIQSGKAILRLHDFTAGGGLDDGIDLLRQIKIGLWMDKYINARTYRGVYALLLTDDPDYRPEGNIQPKPSPKRFLGWMESCGYTTNKGYVMNASPGIGLINQTWMPGKEPEKPVIELGMARDTTRSAGLMFRNGEYSPVTLTIKPGPLKGRWKSYPGAVKWRAVGFAPYGNGREDWSPFFLLRRPFLTMPPLGPAQAWLTVDSTGVPPGTYEAKIIIEGVGTAGQKFATRTVTVHVRVADIRAEPKTPVLIHGWVTPPPGEDYRLDWFKRFNVWQGPFFTKDEMVKYGLKLQIWCQRHVSSNQIQQVIHEAKAKGLGYDDWMFSISDEPTGQTAAELAEYITIGKMIRAADPKVKITLNPGEAARAATFRILQPYADLWNPYALHLSYGPSGRDYLQKPWIWYTTPCYGDKSPGMAAEIYEQVRSILRQPADCRGTAFFAPYYPWRDPWDTAYEHIRDVAVFVLPSRHGPVATPAWEALREAIQHANLARMVRERAVPDDKNAKALWENGSVENILAWLEKNPAR